MKSGNLNFLEPSGPLQACNGTALPLPLPYEVTQVIQMQLLVTQFTIKMFHIGFMQVLILLLKSQYYKIFKALKLSY
jgi:hypothetical protein